MLKRLDIMNYSIRNRLIILVAAAFTLQNLFHLFVLYTAPFELDKDITIVLWVLGLFWLCFTVLCSYFLTVRWENDEFYRNPLVENFRIVNVLLALSAIGVAFHVWAKAYLWTIYPIDCISQTRFAWINADRALLPMHIKAASILGHLLSSFIYPGLALASLNLFFSEYDERSKRACLFIQQMLFAFLGLIYAGMIGSRSCALAFMIMSLGGGIYGLAISKIKLMQMIQGVGFIFGTICVIFFGVYFFSSDRIGCYNDAKTFKPEKVLEYNQSNNRTFSIREPADSSAIWRCVPCGTFALYLNHSIINFSDVTVTEHRGPDVLGGYVYVINEKLNALVQGGQGRKQGEAERVYGPGFLPLAGAAYHDAGYFGVMAVLGLLGAFFCWILKTMQSARSGLLPFAMFMLLFYALMTSTLMAFTNAISFPFMVFSFAIVGLLSKLSKYRQNEKNNF